MPDRWGFDHLVWRMSLTHRCVECGWPEEPRILTEAEREKHFAAHQQELRSKVKRQQRANAKKAREAKRLRKREEAILGERQGGGDE